MRSAAILFSLLLAACGAAEARTSGRGPTRPPIPEAVQADNQPTEQQQPLLGKGKTEMHSQQFATTMAAPAPHANPAPAPRPMRVAPPPRH